MYLNARGHSQLNARGHSQLIMGNFAVILSLFVLSIKYLLRKGISFDLFLLFEREVDEWTYLAMSG